jgi:hypothetical protein
MAGADVRCAFGVAMLFMLLGLQRDKVQEGFLEFQRHIAPHCRQIIVGRGGFQAFERLAQYLAIPGDFLLEGAQRVNPFAQRSSQSGVAGCFGSGGAGFGGGQEGVFVLGRDHLPEGAQLLFIGDCRQRVEQECLVLAPQRRVGVERGGQRRGIGDASSVQACPESGR